jgi:PST family polysaccharide transporter
MSAQPAETGEPDVSRAIPEPALRQRALAGVILVLGQNLATRASSFLAQLALARILTPGDFGAVAVASTISSLSQALVFFGIDQILQQRRQNARFWTTQVFVLSLGFALAGAALMIVAGFLGAALFHDANLPALMAVNGAATVLSALWTVPQAALQWRLRFKFLAGYAAFDAVLSQALMIAAAWLGLGAFSFFAPLVFTNLLRSLVYWRVGGVQLRPIRAARGWGLIVHRGLTALATRIAYVVIAQGDFFILALFAAKPVVGAYFFAFRLASQPMNLLSGSITGVLFSSLLKIPDRARRAAVAFRTAEAVGAVTVPVCLALALAAKPGVVLLFGARWSAAAPLVQLLSLGLAFDAISWPAGALLLAEGAFRRAFIYQTWSLPLFLALVTTGAATAQATGVAAGVAAYYVVHSLAYTAAAFQRTPVGVSGAAGLFGKLLLCAIVGFGPPFVALSAPLLRGHPALQLSAAIVVGPGLYAAALALFARPIFENLVRQGAHLLRRYAPGLQLTVFRWRPAP